MADKILTADELINVLRGRKYKYSQVHHTYQPDHADFNGKNHLALQQGMRNYHVNTRGWDDIGQHVTLMPDGLFVTGRDFDKDLIDFDDTPAGIVGYNKGAFMVEMLGNFDLGHDKLQGAQLESMLKLQHFLVTQCGAEILFHREKANKSCPGTGIDKGWFIQQVANYGRIPAPQVAGVNESTPQPSNVVQKNGTVIVTADNLNLRKGPGTNYPVIRQLNRGDEFLFYAIQDGWYNLGGDQWAFADNGNYLKEKVKIPYPGYVFEYRKPLIHNHYVGMIQEEVNRYFGREVLSVDDYYGQQTARWVKEYQKAHGIKADSEVGPQTWAVMF